MPTLVRPDNGSDVLEELIAPGITVLGYAPSIVAEGTVAIFPAISQFSNIYIKSEEAVFRIDAAPESQTPTTAISAPNPTIVRPINIDLTGTVTNTSVLGYGPVLEMHYEATTVLASTAVVGYGPTLVLDQNLSTSTSNTNVNGLGVIIDDGESITIGATTASTLISIGGNNTQRIDVENTITTTNTAITAVDSSLRFDVYLAITTSNISLISQLPIPATDHTSYPIPGYISIDPINAWVDDDALAISVINAPGRTLDTNFTPSTTRVVFVSYTIKITATAGVGGAQGQGTCELRSDNATTPTTVRCSAHTHLSNTLTNGTTMTHQQITYIVPVGHKVRLVSSTSGNATVELLEQFEEVL